jgi:hypothetical protein
MLLGESNREALSRAELRPTTPGPLAFKSSKFVEFLVIFNFSDESCFSWRCYVPIFCYKSGA